MRPFSLARPTTIESASGLLADGATAIAGGTDLLGLMKDRVLAPERLVDLTRVQGLRGWSRGSGGELRIGALTPLVELETDPAFAQVLPIVPQALAVAATPQLRAMGTVGGNLLQRNRCWYFRDDAFHCWLKGGDRCFAKDGENRYHAVIGAHECVIASPSDLAPALIAYDANVFLHAKGEERVIPLEQLYLAPRDGARTEHGIRPGEVLTSVILAPDAVKRRRGVFIKQMDRKAWSFALVSVAAAARVDDGVLRDVRIVLGGVAPVPWRATAAEALLEGAAPDSATAARAGEAAMQGAEPLRDNAYKVNLARELVRRTVLRLAR